MAIAIIVAVVLAVAALAVMVWLPLAWLVRLVRKHGAHAVLWRFASGSALDGRHRTNATFTMRSRGDKPVLDPTGHAVRWHHLAGWERAMIRFGVLAAILAVLGGLLFATFATLILLAALAATGAGWCGWQAWRKARGWRHYRRWVRPARRALAGELGAPPPRLEIAPDRSRVVIGLPESFTGEDRDKERILHAVTAKLAIEAPDASWKLHGSSPQVTLTKSQPPPPKVMFADILAAVKKAQPHEVVVGIGRKNATVAISVDNDSPHIGLSMGSGDGKSTVAKNFAAQMLYHGALVIILDFKLISHMWARGLPNVAYAGTPAEIHRMLMWLAGPDVTGTGRIPEITRRNQVALAGADIEGKVHANVGPRLFVIAEELNATQARLAAYWRNELWEKGLPKRSPASEALDELMFIGRQVNANALQIGQRLSVKATSGAGGGGDARENLGVKIFCDPSAATWRMLCEGLPQPPAAGHLGRIQVVTRKDVREVQGAYMTGQEARDLALAGNIAVAPHGMPLITPGRVLVPAGARDQLPPRPDQGFDVGQAPPVPLIRPGAVTLSEAVSAGVFGDRSLAAVRKALQRADDAPEPIGRRGAAHEYDISDLYALARK